ncbi:hypothetical protein HED52_21840 [Ochrobactrum ciceri]|uniref:Uncharacterized protein n=1 Tax=Brucella ciceri TaxID=391287 RepID=A0ABX1E2F4_9HYPH|nr:hypothetical protein [Brucella ciceri]
MRDGDKRQDADYNRIAAETVHVNFQRIELFSCIPTDIQMSEIAGNAAFSGHIQMAFRLCKSDENP